MNLSIIIPAVNEADYLPATLDSIQRASEHLQSPAGVDVEVIVVDSPVRQAAGLESAAVHQPALHHAVSTMEVGVGRLVQATRAVGWG